MPELPEVETVRRTLLDLVRGKKIESVDVRWGKIIQKPDDVEEFKSLLVGEIIENIARRGKFLLFELTHYTLVSHLRMEGKYAVANQGDELDKHDHVIFHFTDSTELRYKDVRKFGTMHVFDKGQALNELPLSKLGPEPWDSYFTAEYLSTKLKNKNRKIKIVLLDQELVVGLGNIYVDEVLFRSGVYPERIASSITKNELTKIYNEIKIVLEEAIDKGGSTIRSYVNSQGKIGEFQNKLYVYGRKGEPCSNCGEMIEKIVVGGRGTHYCPNCQK